MCHRKGLRSAQPKLQLAGCLHHRPLQQQTTLVFVARSIQGLGLLALHLRLNKLLTRTCLKGMPNSLCLAWGLMPAAQHVRAEIADNLSRLFI